jgi:hypothetical protein
MKFIRTKLKSLLVGRLNQQGYFIQRLGLLGMISEESLAQEQAAMWRFHERAKEIQYLHSQQTKENVADLQQKYQQPIIGEARVWDLINMLSHCIDPGMISLYCTSQLVHVMQVIELMEQNGETDSDLFLATLIHELGKIALLKGELPENVEGNGRKPIGKYDRGIGLDNCVFQFGHGEIVYLRLKDYVPEHIAWLIRYHDIVLDDDCKSYMNERDRAYAQQYLYRFRKYDQSYSYFRIPNFPLEKYRDMVENAFPNPILF